jgi:hypothetical protein
MTHKGTRALASVPGKDVALVFVFQVEAEQNDSVHPEMTVLTDRF